MTIMTIQGGVSEGTVPFLVTQDDVSIWQWAASEAGASAVGAMSSQITTAKIASLRKTLTSEQVRVAGEVAKGRAKAGKKFDPAFCDGFIGDCAGVEMASSSVSSAYKAKRFYDLLGPDGLVGDLCCGIGGDTWGLRQRGLSVVGVDTDPARVWMYTHNTGCSAICTDAIEGCPGEIGAFHLDPARRNIGGKRTLDIEDFSPGPDAWARLMERHPTGAIKLNPGVDAWALPEGECEILSEGGSLTQAVLWVGSLAGDEPSRATRVERSGVFSTISGEPNRPQVSTAVDQYLGTLDPCLERADLVGSLLDQTGLGLVHPGTGLVTGSAAIEHPMIRWYRVVEVMGWNRKRVKAALRGLGGGVVEVRTRGGVINPDEEQLGLRGKGSNHGLSVLIYRIDTRVVAIIGERLDRAGVESTGLGGARARLRPARGGTGVNS